MKLNFLTEAAFGLLKKVAPTLTPKSFLDALSEDFDPNLSDAENKERMMGAIRKGIFGERLAEAADPNVQADPTIEAKLLSQQPANEAVPEGGDFKKKGRSHEGEQGGY